MKAYPDQVPNIWDETLHHSKIWRHMLQLTLALLFGATIGFTGFGSSKSKKILTYTIVCLASCMFCMMSRAEWLLDEPEKSLAKADQSRIAAAVVTGVGFLGVGFIIKSGTGDSVRGMKQAALLWAAAAVGMGLAYQYYIVAAYIVALFQVFKMSEKFCFKASQKVHDGLVDIKSGSKYSSLNTDQSDFDLQEPSDSDSK